MEKKIIEKIKRVQTRYPDGEFKHIEVYKEEILALLTPTSPSDIKGE